MVTIADVARLAGVSAMTVGGKPMLITDLAGRNARKITLQ